MQKTLTTVIYVAISMFLAVCHKTLDFSFTSGEWDFAYFNVSEPSAFFEWIFLTLGIFAAISLATFLRKKNDLKRIIAVAGIAGFIIIPTIYFGMIVIFYPESFWVAEFLESCRDTYRATAIITIFTTTIGWYKAKQEIKAEEVEE
ncbi:MAG: hypothetical protein WCJ51_05285 [Candidatus Moraniibacteriota bacterium]